MEAISAIMGRRTTPPFKLVEPGPDEAALEQIIAAAVAAPDHGRLKPWRFIAVRGAARAKLGQMIADALSAEDPAMGEAQRAKYLETPQKAPLVLIVAAILQPNHPKIPEFEQIAAAAAATQNLLVAAHAMGFASKWASGKPVFSAGVKRGLGLAEKDQVMAVLYIGTPGEEVPIGPRQAPADALIHWTGPAAA